MGTSERITQIVEPVLQARGRELYDVEVSGPTVRVLVENGPDGVDLAALEELSREISTLLDETDPLPDRFFLEVSSPGLERPLRSPGHFARAVGSVVKIKTAPNVEGDRRVDGTITSADADGFTVETTNGPRRLAYSDVERARTVFQWGPTGKPGSASKPGAKPGMKKRSAS